MTAAELSTAATWLSEVLVFVGIAAGLSAVSYVGSRRGWSALRIMVVSWPAMVVGFGVGLLATWLIWVRA